MKKLNRIFILSCLMVLICSCNSLAQTGTKIEDAKAILNSIVQGKKHVGLSAAIVVNGKLVLAEGFGYKDQENLIKPDENTMFRIYSISKPLAGLLAMKLVEEGKLNIEQPIGEIIPELPKHMYNITTKQLLAHISGIRHYKDGWKEWNAISQNDCKSPMEALGTFIKDPLLFEPGSKVSYTSFGFVLLSAVIEKSGGKLFTKLMEEKLFLPSNAKRITLDGPIDNHPDNMTSFYDYENNRIVKTRIVNNSCKFGGGGYNASAKAIARIWSSYMEPNKIIGKKAYELSKSQIKPNSGEMIYTAHTGIGANVRDGKLSMLTNGAGPGGRSTVYMYPDDGIVVVLISNTLGSKLQKDAIKIANLFLKD